MVIAEGQWISAEFLVIKEERGRFLVFSILSHINFNLKILYMTSIIKWKFSIFRHKSINIRHGSPYFLWPLFHCCIQQCTLCTCCVKDEYIKFVFIIILLCKPVWVEQAHFCLIESICSLFSMVLFSSFWTVTHNSESIAQSSIFLLHPTFASAAPRAVFSLFSAALWIGGYSLCSGEIPGRQILSPYSS